MPFRSEAERRKMWELVQKGRVSKATFDKWEAETEGSIPDKVSNTYNPIRNPRKKRGVK